MNSENIQRVALVGGGVIGSGWATRCLAHGLSVVVTDPAPGAAEFVRKTIDSAWPVLEQAGLDQQASRDKLEFAPDIEAAVVGADFVQENVPEREDLKISVHEEIGRHATDDTVIASSSSGLLPSRLQSRCRRPERLLIGHPFAPVYLLPLVEVVGGKQTSPEAIRAAGTFYRRIGMRPLHVRKEVEAYIADRLQESLYREALHLINDGIATVPEIDAAVTGGPGLRWAFMGTFMAWHLGGGPGGMRHTIEQFGPALELPWSHMEAPKLTEELKNRIVDGCETESGDRDFHELEQRRDQCLVEIQKVLEKYWYPPGEDGWPEMS
ncbi:MAG: 3-hydroxybutyryl-CoA dehydrogenase [Proteobacteria bacterium]|jgi:carnitine 3-dehydrogenase|nr:3-hydroxybutyryl-CoA dehydrogenase [Pseudomonadota bacterium]MBP10573.1 3-hydroxybutyryl-CoA dehydrogenase [Acidiferrobacteraceae bacterium]MDP6137871.1 L-carnitine dehydrogenase [Arenicellales bacterium]MDP7219049.1 L-carnitine dehydrogenase [Arenicellales bacterium]HJP11508.1 L-carnitine dehydrogenase [Arenicellales bacterium]|tara:strand:- start:9325 stop:10296 length:972 start_codon:yes stop_codon:yes gene_type:complete